MPFRREGKAPEEKEVVVGVEDEEGGVGSGQWSSLPMELLVEVMKRVEERDKVWPWRRHVAYCAEVCRSWRTAVMEVVRTVETSGLITFPLSLKQPGPWESPVQCFIRRVRATSMFYLHLGLTPVDSGKFLLAARKIRRATSSDFVVSLSPNDFSRASTMYVGKLRSNFLGTKFTIYDGQPAQGVVAVPSRSSSSRRIHSKQVSPRVSAATNYAIGSISYEVAVLRSRGPRKMLCIVQPIPLSSTIQEGEVAPTTTSGRAREEQPCSMASYPTNEKSSLSSLCSKMVPSSCSSSSDPLVLKNKAPRWHEQLQCWCLNFRGRVTVASVKNFQLVADVQPHHHGSPSERERVILQFGKIGKDIFTMDYRYPISAFQAFAICLSSFDTKPVCE